MNAEVYPYDVVQRLLDQTADLLLYAVPCPGHAEEATLTPDDPSDFFGINGGFGLDVESRLHHYHAVIRPTLGADLTEEQAVGGAVGTFRSRWLFGPADAAWAPDSPPPPALFDPYLPQRFAMHNARFTFDGTKDGFRGYGLGRTFPVTAGGAPQTFAGAVGTLLDGCGRFQGLEGTFVLAGALTADLGFRGAITCRAVDAKGRVRSGRDVPHVSPMTDQPGGATVIVVRGEKKDRTVKTAYGPPPNATQVSLVTPSLMRSVDLGFGARESGGVHTAARLGPVVGEFTATVYFDVSAPPGTAAAPVPFTTDELYTFRDAEGAPVGTVTARVEEGHSFGLQFPGAPGQPAVRFGGVGPVLGGTGRFAGARGLLAVNSLIGISPHALSLIHLMYLVGLDRAGGRGAGGPAADRGTDH